MMLQQRKENYVPAQCNNCDGKMYLFGVFTEKSPDEPLEQYWECESCHEIYTVPVRVDKLRQELDEMEEIYGDFFPEPSEQLDQWNEVYDEFNRLFYPSVNLGTH